MLIAVGAVVQQRSHGCTNWQSNWCRYFMIRVCKQTSHVNLKLEHKMSKIQLTTPSNTAMEYNNLHFDCL